MKLALKVFRYKRALFQMYGNLEKKIKTYKIRMQNKAYTIRNFIQIEQWESGQIYGENFTGRGKFGGRISKKKVTNFHPYQKMVKFRGKIFWGGISQRGGGK